MKPYLKVMTGRITVTAIVITLISLIVSLFGAFKIGKFFTIKFYDKKLPEVKELHTTMHQNPLPEIGTIDSVLLPDSSVEDELYRRAAVRLTEVIKERTGKVPLVIESPEVPPPGKVIAIGTSKSNPFITAQKPFENSSKTSSETFTLQSYRKGPYQVLAIMGGGRTGDVYGIYHVADKLLTDSDIFNMNLTVTPRLKYRFVDTGAVGVAADREDWIKDDYSHNMKAFHDVILAEPPYVNKKAFASVEKEFKNYIHHMISYGYNGIIVSGFLEYINFDYLGNGFEIYDKESDYRKHHLVLRQFFGYLFEYAHKMGMKVVFRTDMVALTPPLKAYFDKRFGGVDVSQKELWEVYRLGFEEFIDVLPFVSGLMIRIGEAGGMYNIDGWNYFSSLDVRTDESVRFMLEQFLDAAQKRDKKILLRSWSIGVGKIGHMHVDPESYERILNDIKSPHLIVSTKYSKGDFYSYLPINPTLKTGEEKRIIEFQARREFEAFNAFPNYLGPLYQKVLLHLLTSNPHIEGLWNWTQNGGPLRAGPLLLYPFHGFWQLVDANVYVTAQLGWNPEADLNELTEIWVRKTFGTHTQLAPALSELMFRSREVLLKGLYINYFSQKQVVALGLQPPPIIWIWDIVCGSNSTLSSVYQCCRNNLEESINSSFEAVKMVRDMRALIESPPLVSHCKTYLCQKLINSLKYEENLFETLAWYVKSFLYFYHWLDSGDKTFYNKWVNAYATYKKKKEHHSELYRRNLDFPAYNFFAANQGMAHIERNRTMTWLSRIILFITLSVFLSGRGFVQHRNGQFPGKKGLNTLVAGLIEPERFKKKSCTFFDILTFFALSFILVTGGVLTFSSFLSPTYVSWVLGSILVFSLSLITINAKISKKLEPAVAASILSSLLFMTILFMAVTSIRGPQYFWYLFWTERAFRITFVFLSFSIMLMRLAVIVRTIKTVYSLSTFSALGSFLISCGIVIIIKGLAIYWIGFETFLSRLNNEIAVFPLVLSKGLGITTHLNITPNIPLYGALSGVIAIGCGWLMRRKGYGHNIGQS